MRFLVGLMVIALLMAGCTDSPDDLQLDEPVTEPVEPVATALAASGTLDPTVAYASPAGTIRPIGVMGSGETWEVPVGHDVVRLTGSIDLDTEMVTQHRVLIRFLATDDTEWRHVVQDSTHTGPASITVDEALDVPSRDGLQLQVLFIADTENPGNACVNGVCSKARSSSTGAEWTVAAELVSQAAVSSETPDEEEAAPE